MSERGAISPERDEIVGERGAELSGAVCCDFERWNGGANTHVSGEREFSPLSSAHMLWRQCLRALSIWKKPWFLSQGPVLGVSCHQKVVSTDSCLTGWGAVMDSRFARGLWQAQLGLDAMVQMWPRRCL